MRIAVLGAGAWGTALAAAAAARHEVLLWARDRVQAAQIERDRCNRRYLPETSLPASLRVSADHAKALDFAAGGLLVVATPMNALRERLAVLPGDANVVWLCKGLEAGSGLLGHEIAAQVRPRARVGVLSGPSFAQEVARALPTAVVAASVDPALCALAVQAFHSDSLRVYTSTDPVGVEVGGAVKNVMAIAAGIADGLGLGLGAHAETFMGLSGLGDLVLTATGALSRNRQVGLWLAGGEALPTILARLGHVAEGVHTAPTLRARAHRLGVDMPITDAVVDVLEARLTPAQALRQLMAREARAES